VKRVRYIQERENEDVTGAGKTNTADSEEGKILFSRGGGFGLIPIFNPLNREIQNEIFRSSSTLRKKEKADWSVPVTRFMIHGQLNGQRGDHPAPGAQVGEHLLQREEDLLRLTVLEVLQDLKHNQPDV
jgi:hypothetical protein